MTLLLLYYNYLTRTASTCVWAVSPMSGRQSAQNVWLTETEAHPHSPHILLSHYYNYMLASFPGAMHPCCIVTSCNNDIPVGGGGGGGGSQGRGCNNISVWNERMLCIGYTLGSQCIPGIYPRWFLITHRGVISKPRRVFPGIHGHL